MASIEIFPGIVSDSEILGGEAVIKGTRIPVSLILGHLAGGMSIDEIVYEYDLTVENVRAALGYAAKRKRTCKCLNLGVEINSTLRKNFELFCSHK